MTDAKTIEPASFDPGQRMHSELPPGGMSGREFVELIKQMDFSPQDLAEMEAALEELGQIDWDAWK